MSKFSQYELVIDYQISLFSGDQVEILDFSNKHQFAHSSTDDARSSPIPGPLVSPGCKR